MSFLCGIARTADLANVEPEWFNISDIDMHYYNGPFLVIKQVSDHADAKVEVYSLYDIKTYQKFGLNILENAYIVMHACQNANLEFLDCFLGSGLELKYNEWAITRACKNGHLGVLNWFLDSGLKLKYNEGAITGASKYGHLDVLDWFLDSGLELKYDEGAINAASKNGHENVLNW